MDIKSLLLFPRLKFRDGFRTCKASMFELFQLLLVIDCFRKKLIHRFLTGKPKLELRWMWNNRERSIKKGEKVSLTHVDLEKESMEIRGIHFSKCADKNNYLRETAGMDNGERRNYYHLKGKYQISNSWFCPKNTSCAFHVEMMWKRTLPRRFNVEYTWCFCRALSSKSL